ncbi:hypothetical protein AB6A40_003596 [Gnathostoma spinigerum]|uniref:Galectin n=1 Tax=Gnathostoma spinigerum TaxID=75299 RepID=A0ABD6ECA1_9BILA
MQLLLPTIFLFSRILQIFAANRGGCGCIDRPGCDEKSSPLDCPLKKGYCKAIPLGPSTPGSLNTAVDAKSKECRDGWTTVSLADSTYGFPNPMVSTVQNDLMDGKEHVMYIHGWNGKYDVFIIFQSKKNPQNVPMFATLQLWKEFIVINERKNNEWCSNDIQVWNRVSAQYWKMRFQIQKTSSGQRIDILLDKQAKYRYYPQTPIERGDTLTSYELGTHILSITWSSGTKVKFKTGPLPGSRIAFYGLLKWGSHFYISLKTANYEEKIKITGLIYGERSTTTVSGYGTQQSVANDDFISGRYITVIVQVLTNGIRVYADGTEHLTFRNDKFRSDHVVRVEVSGGYLTEGGISANTCEFFE